MPTLPQKIKSVASTAINTARHGLRTDDEARAIYDQWCAVCPHLKTKDEKTYCGACGCGAWKMAELRNKLKLQYGCPLKKFPGKPMRQPQRLSNVRPMDSKGPPGRVAQRIPEARAQQIFPGLGPPRGQCGGCK